MNGSWTGIKGSVALGMFLTAVMIISMGAYPAFAAGDSADEIGSTAPPEAQTVQFADRGPPDDESLHEGPRHRPSDSTESKDMGGDRQKVASKPAAANDTTVLWRGFKHAWSYNHRFNRIGSEVEVNPADCEPDRGYTCGYWVKHSGASGSGADDAMFRDAYTELSARGVEFHTGTESFELTGHEDADQDKTLPPTVKNEVTRRPELAAKDQTISGSRTVSVDLDDDTAYADGGSEAAVLLNGFDLHSNPGSRAAKIKMFDLNVEKQTVENGKLKLKIEYEILFDCDSPECKGVAKAKGKKRGGNHVQEVDYELVVRYLGVVGDEKTLNIARVENAQDGRVGNAYGWEECKNNKFGDDSKHDKWNKDKAKYPNNRMYCEATSEEELDSEDFWIEEEIDGKSGYSVGTVGVQSLDFDLDEEAHFTQYDTIVGGSYDQSTGTYEMRALPFFKEWSARPGEYEDAWGAMGKEGHVEIGTTPVLLQLRDGCKRSFVSAGGDTWQTGPGQELDASSRSAVTATSHEFEFGDHWTGHYGNGNQCGYDENTKVDAPGEMAHQDWNGIESDFWAEQDKVDEDPTSIREMPSDRYYRSPSSPDYYDFDNVVAEGVTATGDRGNMPLVGEEYTNYHAGTFIGQAAVDVNAAGAGMTDIERFLHNKETGEIRRMSGSESASPNTDFVVKDPGEYAVVTVAQGLTRIGDPPPTTRPSVAVLEFEVVDDPTYPRETVSYRLKGGGGKVISYQWNDSATKWERVNSEKEGVVAHRQKPTHRFNGSVTPNILFEHTKVKEGAYHDVHLQIDGQNVASGHEITKPGNHTMTLYVCYNTVGANCNAEALYKEQATESPDRDGPTKGNDDRSGKRLSGGVAVVANHTLQIRSGDIDLSHLVEEDDKYDLTTGTDTEEYDDALEEVDIGGDVPVLIEDERITIVVVDSDEAEVYAARTENGEIQEIESGAATDPTMKVTMDKGTMQDVTRSEDRKQELTKQYEAGEISVTGVGTVNKVKIRAVKVAKSIHDLATGLLP